MNIYLDLEANAITQEIISIGAVSEEGNEFYSLVKPHTRLDRKIKELTGISQEDVDGARSIDEVIESFYHWIFVDLKYDPWSFPKLYVFGTGDKGFINSSICFSTYEVTRERLEEIRDHIENTSKRIAKKFNRDTISLRSAYLTMRLSAADTIEKTHNALDDATMLKWVWENIDNYQLPEGVEVVKVERPNMSYKAALKNSDPRLSRKIKITRPARGNRPAKEWIAMNASHAYGFLTPIDGAKKKNVLGKIIAACESGEKYRNRYFSFVD